MKRCDFAIVGAGAGGCAAAIMAARMRQRVVLIERDKIGGTSLHYGCTPTKSLLVSARHFHTVKHSGDFGVAVNQITGRLTDFLTRERNVVAKSYQVLLEELSRWDVSILRGTAAFLSANQLEVTGEHETEVVEARKIILATGSAPQSFAQGQFQGVLNSNDFLNLTEVPETLIFVGGGAIPCELASIYAALGAKIVIIEKADRLLPGYDPDVSHAIRNALENMGVEVLTGKTVRTAQSGNGRGYVEMDGDLRREANAIVVAIGRTPKFDSLQLDRIGMKTDGFIQVDSRLETSVQGVYAVGECNGMLNQAHAAILQGRMAVRNALGEDHRFEPRLLPRSLYTTPEVAAVGLSEQEALDTGYQAISSQFPLSNIGRAVSMGEAQGFVKLVADRASRKLLGASIVGGHAAEMIAQLATALTFHATVDDLVSIAHAHPTFCEAIQEAAWEILFQLRRS